MIFSFVEISAVSKRRTPNPKRRILSLEACPEQWDTLGEWADSVKYKGNPVHKKNPGDFALEPPSCPRQGKTLCDGAEVFSYEAAVNLLRTGVVRGLVSEQRRNGWPQNIWAVAPNGVCVEAMLDNRETGTYHGYPMLSDDPLCAEIFRRWAQYE